MLNSRKLKRTLALLLCVVMVCSMSAFAAGNGTSELLPLSVVEFFAEQGYNISRTAKMEPVSSVPQAATYGLNAASSNSAPAYTLKITEQDGDNVTVYHTVLLAKNDGGVYERDNDIMEYMIARGIGDPVDSGSAVIGNKIALTARTSYSTGVIQGLATVYKPKGLSFSYSTYMQCNVGSIEVTYDSKGTAYSGLNSTTPVAYNYRYPIIKTVSAPVAGSLYSTSSTCPYYIDTAYGGMALTYTAKIDGVTYRGDLT